MVLKQFYEALAGVIQNKTLTGVKSTSGNSMNLATSYANMIMQFSKGMATVAGSSYTSPGCVVFGTGDKAVAFDDYRLSSDQITTLSGSGTVNCSFDDTGFTASSLLTVTNNGSTDVTIREIGLVMQATGNWYYLVDRTILDSPLTVPAGGIGQVVYTIRMNYPT